MIILVTLFQIIFQLRDHIHCLYLLFGKMGGISINPKVNVHCFAQITFMIVINNLCWINFLSPPCFFFSPFSFLPSFLSFSKIKIVIYTPHACRGAELVGSVFWEYIHIIRLVTVKYIKQTDNFTGSSSA